MSSLILVYVCLVFLVTTTCPLLTHAVSDCNGTCTTLDDCSGQLICINTKCNDDPDVGTSICKGGGSSAPTPSPLGLPISDCDGECTTLHDCPGQLICINKKCNDDPEVGTNLCKVGGSASPPSLSQGNTKKSNVRVELLITIPLLLFYFIA